jgi:hypothetical protein
MVIAMSKTVDPTDAPTQVLDGVQIAETETGDRYTVTIDNDEVTVASLDGEDVRQPTPREFDRWLKHGEFYVPEYSPAGDVHEAAEQLAGGQR